MTKRILLERLMRYYIGRNKGLTTMQICVKLGIPTQRECDTDVVHDLLVDLIKERKILMTPALDTGAFTYYPYTKHYIEKYESNN